MVNPLLPSALAAWWRRLRHQLPAQAALAWLLLALVVAPTVGRVHQVEHAGELAQMRAGHAAAQPKPVVAFPVQQDSAPAAAEGGHAHQLAGHPGLLSLLLAPHAPVDCLLLDQLALGEALHSLPEALPPPAPAQAPQVAHAGRTTAPHRALFQARGPPAA
jgi:hypothetical protein